VNDFVILDSDTTYNLSEMAVAVNRSGQGVVVWADTDGAMLRSYSPSSGTWAAARNVGNVGLLEPSVVMAQDGTVTVAWSQWVNGFYNVWTMEGTVSGAWTAPMALETDNLSIPNDQYASDTVGQAAHSLACGGWRRQCSGVLEQEDPSHPRPRIRARGWAQAGRHAERCLATDDRAGEEIQTPALGAIIGRR